MQNNLCIQREDPPVLGLNACLDLDLIKLVLSVTARVDQKTIKEEFSDVFKGIGLFPGECTIHLDPAATPAVCPPRRVPIAQRSRLQKALQHMEDTEIIAKVTEPSEWCWEKSGLAGGWIRGTGTEKGWTISA